MNRDAERELLAEYLAACGMIASTFGEATAFAERVMPVDPANGAEISPGLDKVAVLSFLKSFEQFEDVLQRTIKTIIQVMEQGRIERLTGIDIANRGAALGILDDAERWSDAVRTRNALAHEYPLDAAKRAAQVNNAWAMREVLNEVWRAVLRFVEKEGLQ